MKARKLQNSSMYHKLMQKLYLQLPLDWHRIKELLIEKCIERGNFKSNYLIIPEINNFIELKNIKIVFFDVDFIKFINLFFIKKINNVKKILMTFDDFALHEMNAITANACDLVLSHCPFSVKKYEEKGYETFFMPCESDGNILKNYNLKKEIDVLFFGDLTSDRKEFVDFVAESGISIKKVGYDTKYVSDEELATLISKSKIVLNLSK